MMRLATLVALFSAAAAAPLEQNTADDCPTAGSVQLQVKRQPFVKFSGGFSMGSEEAAIVSAPQSAKLEPPKLERPAPEPEVAGARASGGFSVAAQSTEILTETAQDSFVSTEGPLVSMGQGGGDGEPPEPKALPPVHDDEEAAVDSLLGAYNGALKHQEEMVASALVAKEKQEMVASALVAKEKQERLRAEKERLALIEQREWAKLDAKKVLLETARNRVVGMEQVVDQELDKILKEEQRLGRDLTLPGADLQKMAAVERWVEKDHDSLLADRDHLRKTEAKISKEEKHLDEIAAKYRHHPEHAQAHPKQAHGAPKRAHGMPAVL